MKKHGGFTYQYREFTPSTGRSTCFWIHGSTHNTIRQETPVAAALPPLDSSCPVLGFFLETFLVGGFSPTPLKNMLVKLDHETPSRGENKKYLSCHHPVFHAFLRTYGFIVLEFETWMNGMASPQVLLSTDCYGNGRRFLSWHVLTIQEKMRWFYTRKVKTVQE